MIIWKQYFMLTVTCLLVACSAFAQSPLKVLQAFNDAHEQKPFYAYALEVKQFDGKQKELASIAYKVLCDNNGRTLIQFEDGSEQLRTDKYSIRIGHAEKRFIVEPGAGQSMQDQWKESMNRLKTSADVRMETNNGTCTISYKTEEDGLLHSGSIRFNPATTEMLQSIITVTGDLTGDGSAQTVNYVVTYQPLPFSNALKAQLMEHYIEINQKDIQPTAKFNDYEVISTL